MKNLIKKTSIIYLIGLASLSAEKNQDQSYVTIYPDVIVRDSPNIKGKKLQKLQSPTILSSTAESLHEDTIIIRNKAIKSKWLKVDYPNGWVFGGLTMKQPKIGFIIPGSYHTEDVTIEKNDLENWIGYSEGKNKYNTFITAITLENGPDPVYETEQGIHINTKVKKQSEFLIKGITLGKHDLTIVSKKSKEFMNQGDNLLLEYKKIRYAFKISKIDSKWNSLTLSKNNETMTIDTFEINSEDYPEFNQAADFDGDGELDFIIDFHGKNWTTTILYLSSMKKNDFFIIPVASIFNMGC